jgi:hypothetical protein
MRIRSEQRGLAAAVLGAVLTILIPMFAHAGQVTFRWDYTPSGAAGFKLYCGPTEGEYTLVVDAGNTDVYKLAGLREGNLYRCAVTAYDSRRSESPLSSPVHVYVSRSGECLTGCDGDMNRDGAIDVRDLAVMKETWGSGDGDADLNGDGIVNVLDLALFRVLFQ